MPKTYHTREALATVASFSAAVPRLLVELKQFVKARKLAVTSNTVVVMATNFGTLDLVANVVRQTQGATRTFVGVLRVGETGVWARVERSKVFWKATGHVGVV